MKIAPDYQRAYCFKYGLLYIGWTMSVKRQENPYYFDDRKTLLIYPESWLDYVTFGFTKESVMNKLRKRYEKLKNLHSKY